MISRVAARSSLFFLSCFFNKRDGVPQLVMAIETEIKPELELKHE